MECRWGSWGNFSGKDLAESLRVLTITRLLGSAEGAWLLQLQYVTSMSFPFFFFSARQLSPMVMISELAE